MRVSYIFGFLLIFVAILGISWTLVTEFADDEPITIQDTNLRMQTGSILSYDATIDTGYGVVTGNVYYEVKGVNNTGVLYCMSYDLYYSDGTSYVVNDVLALSNDSITEILETGKHPIRTIDGYLMLDYIKYEDSNTIFIDYYDPFSNLLYLSVSEDGLSKVSLVNKDIKWVDKDAYFSDFLGISQEYDLKAHSRSGSICGKMTIDYVADCGAKLIGVRQNIELEGYLNISYSIIDLSSDGSDVEIMELENHDGVLIRRTIQNGLVNIMYSFDPETLLIHNIEINDENSESVWLFNLQEVSKNAI